MYAKGYAVVNIHDALVVLDTEENIHLFPNEVEEIIKTEYLKYNLHATCKVDYFNLINISTCFIAGDDFKDAGKEISAVNEHTINSSKKI